MERQFTNITFEKIESLDRDPYHWELAHAFLNASEWGCMTIREIADEVYNRFPAKYNNDEDAQQACLSTLRNNMSISPDFVKDGKPEGQSCFVWKLTGSEIGVPRPDKREAKLRRAAASASTSGRNKKKNTRSLRGIQTQEESTAAAIPQHLIHPGLSNYPGAGPNLLYQQPAYPPPINVPGWVAQSPFYPAPHPFIPAAAPAFMMHQYPAYPPPIGAAALVPRYPTPELLNPGSAAAALMLQNPGYAAPNLFSQAETAPATNQGPSHMAYHLLGKPEANLAPVPYRTVSPGLYFTQPVPLNQPEILIDPALLKQQDSVATLVNHGHPEHAKEEPTFAGLAYPHYVDPRELEYQSDDEDDVDYSQYSEPEDLESYHSPDDTPLPITKDTEAIRELFIAELRKEGLLDEETKQARPAPRRLTRINRTTTSS